jgi:hypothetical protein
MKKLLAILMLALLTAGTLSAEPRFIQSGNDNPTGPWGEKRP